MAERCRQRFRFAAARNGGTFGELWPNFSSNPPPIASAILRIVEASTISPSPRSSRS
jgi:hypothetical protein